MKNIKLWELQMLLGMMIFTMPLVAHAELRAGAAKRVITPQMPVYLAGLSNNRLSIVAHDPLYARSVVFEDEINSSSFLYDGTFSFRKRKSWDGKTRIGLVSLDLIGLLRRDVQKIQNKLREAGVETDCTILTCTHVHSGPDTIGLWGPNAMTSGVNQDYMEYLQEQIVACVLEAQRAMQPASLRLGQVEVPPKGVSHNVRVPDLIDRTLGLIQFVDAEGNSIANVVNFTAHPEVLWSDSKYITADYVASVYSRVDSKLGGITLFINGALGGMVTVDNQSEEGEDKHTFSEAERIGNIVAQKAIEAASNAQEQKSTDIIFRHGAVRVPVENPGFLTLAEVGILPKEMFRDGYVETEVSVIQMGNAQIATFPGEALPKLGLQVKSAMTTPYKFVFGLANDELGYIIPAEDFSDELYDYERSMSVGSQIGPATTGKILALLSSIR
ncbi:hypothetical protein FJZ31_23610 [Candidatus Poribacteria bacterium]|nr:hypothetical protein [Candidatus Poribacteria bacterium]